MSKPVKIDEKGRLKIPASLSSGFRELGSGFFITSEDGQSARIYPLRVWQEIEKQLIRMSQHNRHMQKLLLRAKYFGQTVNMDAHGRVLIPAMLRKTALIKGEADVLDYPAMRRAVGNINSYATISEPSPLCCSLADRRAGWE